MYRVRLNESAVPYIELFDLITNYKTSDKEGYYRFVGWVKSFFEQVKLGGKRPPSVPAVEWDYLKVIKKNADESLDDRIFGDEYIYKGESLVKQFKNLRAWDSYKTDIGIGSALLKIVGRNAVFHNDSGMSNKNFTTFSQSLDNFMDRFSGRYKEVLSFKNKWVKDDVNKLHIYFVTQEKSKARATYKTAQDIIYIRSRDIDTETELYGHLKYVLVHELGHRYEYHKNLESVFGDRFDSAAWWTTDYSKRNDEAEIFAELFALNFWYEDYVKQYPVLKKFHEIFK